MEKSNKIIETTGKIEDAPRAAGQPVVFTRLEQVWGGFNEQARYGTTKEEEYEAQLSEMNRPDMEAHARRLGVVVLESTARLKDSLKKEFQIYVSTLLKPKNTSTGSVTSKAGPIPDEVRRILAEGK